MPQYYRKHSSNSCKVLLNKKRDIAGTAEIPSRYTCFPTVSLKLVTENCQAVVDTLGFALPCPQPLPRSSSAGDLQLVLSEVLGSWLLPHVFGLQLQVYICPSLAARLLNKYSGALFAAEPSVLHQVFSGWQGHTLMYTVSLK